MARSLPLAKQHSSGAHAPPAPGALWAAVPDPRQQTLAAAEITAVTELACGRGELSARDSSPCNNTNATLPLEVVEPLGRLSPRSHAGHHAPTQITPLGCRNSQNGRNLCLLNQRLNVLPWRQTFHFGWESRKEASGTRLTAFPNVSSSLKNWGISFAGLWGEGLGPQIWG